MWRLDRTTRDDLLYVLTVRSYVEALIRSILDCPTAGGRGEKGKESGGKLRMVHAAVV